MREAHGSRPTVSLDHHSEWFREHNYAFFDEHRSTCPVIRSERHGGFWMLLDHDSALEALRDDDLFSSADGTRVPSGDWPRLFPIDTDPPETDRYRRVLQPLLSPAAVAQLQPMISLTAQTLVDGFIESGEADLVIDLAVPMAAVVVLDLLGFADAQAGGLEAGAWRTWVADLHHCVHDRDKFPERAVAASAAIVERITDAIEQRRRHGLREDLLSGLVGAPAEDGSGGPALTDGEIVGCVFLLLLAGMDPTAGLTSNALWRMHRDHRLRGQLAEDWPSLAAAATEEFCRHDTPTQGLARTVTRSCTFHGQELTAGDKVIIMFASANRDPKVFERPDRLDLDRATNPHLSFGAGSHRCLGAHLARAMFRAMLGEVLTRLGDYEVIEAGARRFADAGEVFGFTHLPVRFTPGPRLGSSTWTVQPRTASLSGDRSSRS